MNGVALALTLATLGVDYSYRTTEEGQLEYTIQIEPEFLKSLAEGEEIHSDVPPDAGQVERICVRIGTAPVRHTAASIQQFKRLLVAAPRFASSDPALASGEAQRTILWPARSNPEESFGASYGWQPDQQGQLAYYVQIDSTTLKTLAAGDEIHAAIDPTAGRVSRFVISSGNKPLPRIAPPPAQVATVAPLPSSKSRTRFQTGDDAGAAPGSTLPPASGYRTGDYAPLASSAPPAAAEIPDPYAPAQPRFNTSREPAASDLRAPAPQAGGYTGAGTLLEAPPRTQYNSPATAQPPQNYSANDPMLNDARGYNPAAPPSAPRFDQYRNNTLQPPVDISPAPNYVQPVGGEQPQYQQPTTRYSPPLANDRLASASLSAGGAPSSSPGIPVATSPAGLAATTTEPSPLSNSPTGLMWLVAMFLLFLSIGGNLYLGWTAAEFYSRYRLAVDRLRTAGRA